MPVHFQVLKCYKCSVFQVHQAKKSNKFECKLCGEKQSIKRHYGFGTGKECRIHVQKLNGLRGELEESKSTPEDSDCDESDHNSDENKTKINNKPISKSKWLEYVESKETIDVEETTDTMYLDDMEVVLEIPKRQRINKKKFKSNRNAYEANYFENPVEQCRKRTFQTNNIPEYSETNRDKQKQFITKSQRPDTSISLNINKTQLTALNQKPKVNDPFAPIIKQSKWSKYEEVFENDDEEDDENIEIIENNTYIPHTNSEVPIFKTKDIFKENDIENTSKVQHDNRLNITSIEKSRDNINTQTKFEVPTLKQSNIGRNDKITTVEHNETNNITLVPQKQSKWAHYTNEVKNLNHEKTKRSSNLLKGKSQKMFSLCDDNDLDSVLDI